MRHHILNETSLRMLYLASCTQNIAKLMIEVLSVRDQTQVHVEPLEP